MRLRRWLMGGAALALIGALAWLWISGLIGLGLHLWAMRGAEADWRDKGLWLPFYQVTIEARPVVGLSENVSGLTFSPVTGTLFAAINRPPALAEIATDGRLLRLIPLEGARDLEGITHVEGNRFVVSDEGDQRLAFVEITPQTTRLSLAGLPHLTLDFGTFANMGFEGVSWDQRRGELLVAQEMWPVRVLVIAGFAQTMAGPGLDVTVHDWVPQAQGGHFTADLSSLSAHDATGNLVLLSDLTSALVEYARDGRPVSALPLWAGWAGLAADVPQAEGLAIGPEGDLYLVSEPNLFYRFTRNPRAPWAEEEG
ncbi:SdiA-regulated domain-containing protein [Neotabrizicola sp. sgz301269]|uniref:SdiA-regulated domain-containing protein n=1 Tax=Neotabrizicola sp. sgz301269 TaxID=3276282 RepID=UPI0037702BC1